MSASVRQTLTSVPDIPAPDIRQREASDPGSSVWVNASAGSGKTTVLTNRVMRLLLAGIKPQKILCLTYTRAAAAEMALRINERLGVWATCGDNDLNASIGDLQGMPPTPDQMINARRLFARVLGCPGGMRIRTIHAFCQEILRRFPIEAGLPPHFAVIEENDARALQDEVQSELLREAGENPNGDLGRALRTLIEDSGEAGFTAGIRSILSERARLGAALQQYGGVDGLIGELHHQLGLKPNERSNVIRRAAVEDQTLPRIGLLQAAAALCKGLKICQSRGRKIQDFLALPVEDRAQSFDDYADLFFTIKGEYLKKYTDKDSAKALPEAEDILTREAVRLQAVRQKLEAADLAECTKALIVFGGALIRTLGTRKVAQAVMDYDDLIIKTDALLRRSGIAPWILYKLDGGVDHILVDEAQDTSRAQWSIVAALADEFFSGATARNDASRTLFVVGDEKQSIFSFQRAEPEAFHDMRAYFAQKILDAEKKYRDVPMQVSFRSAPAILQAVDAIFAQISAKSGVSRAPVRHDAAPLRPGDNEKIGRVEVWPLLPAVEKKAAAEEAWQLPLGYEEERDTEAELAQKIAIKISDWLKNAAPLPGQCRAIQPGDIMILLRRRGRFADLMVRALKQRDVPVTGVDRMRLVTQLAVMDLLALLQFTLLPEDDLNLATVLRGPLLGLSEDDLMELAIGRPDGLWNSLLRKAASRPVFQAAHDYLQLWFNRADFASPFDILSKILNEPCPGNTAGGRRALWARLGADALDPIDELLNAALDFSRRHAPSLQAFLHWLMATESDIKRELDHGGGQVRIMTVHASKGLEAPIVFLPDTASTPRVQDIPKFMWSDNDVPLYLNRKPGQAFAKILWDTARRKQLEEYRRLLYVALTRAANQLYICGWEPGRKDPDSFQSWYQLCADGLKPLHEPASVPDDDAVIAFADPELRPVKVVPDQKNSKSEKIILPAWARVAPQQELTALPGVVPSQLGQPSAATPDAAFARGRLIHRLLQSLPDVADEKRDAIAARFLGNPQHGLTKAQQHEIQREVLDLVRHPDYAPLFGPGSQAEIPLIGQINGQPITGQVDRLALRNNEVWIVDYKTNRPPPLTATQVPEAYLRQLASYRRLLQDIYPGKALRCFLLWTYGLRLMELPESLLTGP